MRAGPGYVGWGRGPRACRTLGGFGAGAAGFKPFRGLRDPFAGGARLGGGGPSLGRAARHPARAHPQRRLFGTARHRSRRFDSSAFNGNRGGTGPPLFLWVGARGFEPLRWLRTGLRRRRTAAERGSRSLLAPPARHRTRRFDSSVFNGNREGTGPPLSLWVGARGFEPLRWLRTGLRLRRTAAERGSRSLLALPARHRSRRFDSSVFNRNREGTGPPLFLLVGARGFEPPTLCSQSRCATRLRHAPCRPL